MLVSEWSALAQPIASSGWVVPAKFNLSREDLGKRRLESVVQIGMV